MRKPLRSWLLLGAITLTIVGEQWKLTYIGS